MLRAANSLVISTNSGEQALAAAIVRTACEEPIRQMAINSGESPDLIVKQVLEASDTNQGWNFLTQKIDDLFNTGVIDPVKVTRTALLNAASCAGTLITTNYGIIQTGEKE